MSEWDIRQRGFEYIPTRNWTFHETSNYPNAWGFFIGGGNHELGRDMLKRFALRMLIGGGIGTFVRAEKFYDIPEAYRQFQRAPIAQVMICNTVMNVVGEGMFPFRMWSADLESYISLSLKVLVVEDEDPNTPNEFHIDMWVGLDSSPFIETMATVSDPRMFKVNYNFNDRNAEEDFVDVGAWTQAERSDRELRPRTDGTIVQAIRHQRVVIEWFKSGEFHRLLQLSAQGARPRNTPEAELEDLYTDEELDRAVERYVQNWEHILQQDARRQLEGGDI
ncbi:hypothetical protein LTR84_006207 [Exophiala bonariae]|uniref:HNH nuclease domain-containing protein n=1 Tax=Exophiala bonariae TaxID=1690606 RepID=A0AAV9N251_9EURO|nr:hypothetical protein LTR84_006207 [Exophiala bonariae]